MKRIHIFQDSSSFLREQRLVCYKSANNTERENILEEVENNDGKEEKAEDPLRKLRSSTEHMVAVMQTRRVGFWERVNHLGSTESARAANIQKELKKEANVRLDKALSMGQMGAKTRLWSAERKILLQNIEQQVLADLQKYLELEQNELREKSEKYGRWANFLGGGTDAISKKQINENQDLLAAMNKTQERLTVKINGKEVPEKVAFNQETEKALREQLIDLNIVDADKFDRLMELHFAGSSSLIDEIKKSSILNKNPALQKSLVRAAKRIRKRGQRSYRLYNLAKEDPNMGSINDRLNYISEKAAPGYPIALNVGGTILRTHIIRFQGDKCILRDRSNPKRYAVLDTNEGAVAYRNTAGEMRDTKLSSTKSIVLNPGNLSSIAA